MTPETTKVKPLTEFQQRLLIAMPENWVSAGWMASKMWPEKYTGPWSRRSAKWQKMGAMLKKLYDRGLVIKDTTEHGQHLWRRIR